MIRRPGATSGRGGEYTSPYANGVRSGGYGGGYGNPASPSPSSGGYSGGYAGASPVPPPPFGGGTGNGYSSGGAGGYSSSGDGGGGSSSYGGGYSGSNTTGNSSNPFGSAMYKDKRRGSGTPIQKLLQRLKDPSSLPILTTILFLFGTMYYRSNYNSVLKLMNIKKGGYNEIKTAWENIHGNHETKTRHLSSIHEQHSLVNKRLADCDTMKRTIQRERDECRTKLDRMASSKQATSTTGTSTTTNETHHSGHQLAKHIQREKVYRDQLALLQNATQRESRRVVIEKFGPGPHYVEFTIELPVLEHEDTWYKASFTIEMAPLSMMPHAIHLFLEQVSHGLWTGGWFYINGPHVLQAGPQADDAALEIAYEEAHALHGDNMNDIDEREVALRPFRQKDLAHLSFQEYSPQFPHVEWTVGFTGRPGGPDFYINKIDNSISHGPGGQAQHDIPDSADPCFARIYSGFDTIEALTKVPTVQFDAAYKNFYEEPIHMSSVRILSQVPFQSELDMRYLKYTPEQKQLKQVQMEQQKLANQQQHQQQLANQQQQQQQGVGGGQQGINGAVFGNTNTGVAGAVQQDVVGQMVGMGGVVQQQPLEQIQHLYGQQQQQQQGFVNNLQADPQHQQINNNNNNQQQQQQQQIHHHQDDHHLHHDSHHHKHKYQSHGNVADMVEP